MMRRIDNPPRCRKVAPVFGRRGAASRITQGGFTPRSAARTIRDDTRGTPGAFRPWTNCRPKQGRCAHEENARVFHQGPDPCVVHREAGYIDAALHLSGSSRDTPTLHQRLGPYIILCSRPSHSSSFRPTPAKVRVSRKPWLECACGKAVTTFVTRQDRNGKERMGMYRLNGTLQGLGIAN
jgi:hypothetical protein